MEVANRHRIVVGVAHEFQTMVDGGKRSPGHIRRPDSSPWCKNKVSVEVSMKTQECDNGMNSTCIVEPLKFQNTPLG